jgi:hypothetical protein
MIMIDDDEYWSRQDGLLLVVPVRVLRRFVGAISCDGSETMSRSSEMSVTRKHSEGLL